MKIPRLFAFCLLPCFAVSVARAVDPNKLLSQYAHTAWRVQDGAVSPAVAITQTTDGYIWLGTADGLMRFDGARFVAWHASKGQVLPRRGFSYLLGSRDGSLWIGSPGGLSRIKDGQVQTYSQVENNGIGTILEDHAGTIWVTRYRIRDGKGALCRVAERELHCYGKDEGVPLSYGQGLAEDSLGDFWIGGNVLCRWRPGSGTTYFDDEVKHLQAGDGVVDVAAGESGAVWASIDGVGPKLGVRHYSEGKWSSYVVPGFDGAAARSSTLFVDRHKSLWIGTNNKGIYHVHGGVAEHYGSADGLSGDAVQSIYEDHEGNLWVVTDGGMDMFRDTPVVSVTLHEGLSAANIKSVVALSNGSVWIGNEGAVDILREEAAGAGLTVTHALSGHDVGTMFEDHTGAVWMGIDHNSRLMVYDHGELSEVKRSDGSALGLGHEIASITEDVEHNLWVVDGRRESHLFRVKDRRVLEDIPLSGEIPNPIFLAADRRSGIWISSRRGALVHYRDGRFEAATLAPNESALSASEPFVDADNSVWVPTNRGLFRWSEGRVQVLDARNGLPCDSFFAARKDVDGSLWLYARCGLLRVGSSGVMKWLSQPDSHLDVEVFDALDGARPGAHAILSPTSSRAIDGRLWFTNGFLVQMVDPNRLYRNGLPPPVYIEEIIADHKSYEFQDHLRLPPLTSELEIDYTALSFPVPKKVRFRYKLEGRDEHWEEPGTRRQAFYEDLSPGKYRFRVIACNNDGVWNEVGASLEFSIAPAWYQTPWFRVLCLVAGLLIVWALFRLRMRQVAKVIGARFDERLAERTRLARELHDTLLQTIQGSKMVADDALDPSTDPVRMRRAMERLSQWLGQSMQEVRTALNSLRTSTTQKNDLAESLQRATEDCIAKGLIRVSLSVTGTVQEMHPIVRDEIYRIGYEAIRNADSHSGASRLEVELTYARDLVLRIRDNGVGIDRVVLEGGKEGHFGLQGMRERAARIGATFSLVSSPGSGTEITLTIPGSIIFQKQKAAPFKTMKNLFRRSDPTSKLD